LQGLVASVFPPDPRRAALGPARTDPARESADADQPPRPPELAPPGELSWLLLAVPVWALVAQIAWRLLPIERDDQLVPLRYWRGLVLVWAVALALFAAWGILGYLGRRNMARRAAR